MSTPTDTQEPPEQDPIPEPDPDDIFGDDGWGHHTPHDDGGACYQLPRPEMDAEIHPPPSRGGPTS